MRTLRAARPRRHRGAHDDPERLLWEIRRQHLKLYFFAGQPLPGLHALLRQLNEAEAAGPSNELVNAFAGASAFFATLGLRRIARFYYHSAARSLGGIEDLATLGNANHVLSLFHLLHADWELTTPLIDASVAAHDRLGARQTEAGLHPLTDRAILWLYMGRLGDSAAGFEEVVALARRNGYTVSELQAHVFLAEVERRRGRLDTAREHAERVLDLIGQQQFPAEKLIALSVLALTQPQTGQATAREAVPLLKFAPGLHYSRPGRGVARAGSGRRRGGTGRRTRRDAPGGILKRPPGAQAYGSMRSGSMMPANGSQLSSIVA